MQLVTLLGTGTYSATSYVWEDGSVCETRLFPVALATWLQPKEVRVLLTAGAKVHENWEELQRSLSDKVKLVPINIPDGRNEAELWELFRVLTSELPEDEFVFDVTHGFRSLPLLTLLAAVFLRIARGGAMSRVVYGAYEPNVKMTPVFDLTPFLTLLEWAAATEVFRESGDARRIGSLVQEGHRSIRLNPPPDAEDLPRQLQSLGKEMGTLSLALSMIRPREVPHAAEALIHRLDTAEAEARRWMPPLTLLLDQVRDTYAPLAFPAPETDVQAHLHVQWRQLLWYIERQQGVQAITLAREWLVSIVCWKCNFNWIDEKQGRDQAETLLSNMAYKGLTVENLASAGGIAQVWQVLTDFRNDVDHCGMRKSPSNASSLQKNILELRERLQSIAQACGLVEDA